MEQSLEMKKLEKEIFELKVANEILTIASAFLQQDSTPGPGSSRYGERYKVLLVGLLCPDLIGGPKSVNQAMRYALTRYLSR